MPQTTDRTVGAPTCRRIAFLLIASGQSVTESNLNALWERFSKNKMLVRESFDRAVVELGQARTNEIRRVTDAMNFPVVPIIGGRLSIMPVNDTGEIPVVQAPPTPAPLSLGEIAAGIPARPGAAPAPAPVAPPAAVAPPVTVGDAANAIAEALATEPAPRVRRTMAEIIATIPARTTPAVFRNRGYTPNYPRSLSEVLTETQRFGGDTLRFMRAFKRSHPWTGTFEERKAKFVEMLKGLAHIYGVQNLNIVIADNAAAPTGGPIASGSSSYNHETNTITLVGRLSVVTALHEFAHARGANERQAVRWSAQLYRRVWPLLFLAAQQVGHTLVLPGRDGVAVTDANAPRFSLNDILRWTRGERVAGLPVGVAAPAPVQVAAPVSSRFRPAAAAVTGLAASLGVTPDAATRILDIIRSSGAPAAPTPANVADMAPGNHP